MGSLLLYPLLPAHHLTGETRDAVRVGIGMVSILTTLELGLLLASAKGTLGRTDQQVRSYAADLILLVQTLRAILALAPANDEQRWLRNQALGVAASLIHTRWLVLVIETDAISPVLLGIVIA